MLAPDPSLAFYFPSTRPYHTLPATPKHYSPPKSNITAQLSWLFLCKLTAVIVT